MLLISVPLRFHELNPSITQVGQDPTHHSRVLSTTSLTNCCAERCIRASINRFVPRDKKSRIQQKTVDGECSLQNEDTKDQGQDEEEDIEENARVITGTASL